MKIAKADIGEHLRSIAQFNRIVKNYIKMKTIDTKQKVLSEYAKGNIVIATIDGIEIAPMSEFMKQPVDGMLYDINRNEATILTFIDDKKWVNDYACVAIIRAQAAEIERLNNELLNTKSSCSCTN